LLFGPCKVVIKKSSVEERQSSSGVPSEQLVESWALRGRLRRWSCELSWQSSCEKKTLRVLQYSDIWSELFSETDIVPVFKSVARKRIMKTAID
jgi:hypothetical protein